MQSETNMADDFPEEFSSEAICDWLKDISEQLELTNRLLGALRPDIVVSISSDTEQKEDAE